MRMVPLALGLAIALEVTLKEFPPRVHPVVHFGSLVERVDREWKRPRLAGTAVALFFPVAVAILAWGVTAGATTVSPFLGAAVGGLLLFATMSLRMLLDVGREVIAGTDATPERAREEVSALVGRDSSTLSPAELRSAAVESLAENLADGLVAPLVAFALGAQLSLAIGIAVAVWVKAVNTLDSMLGYRTKPHGAASARLDDMVMWIPARVSALLLALAARQPTAVVRAREWARVPASPNSGWPMATLAVALNVKLQKADAYTLNPDRPLPTVADGERAVRVVAVAGVLALGGAVGAVTVPDLIPEVAGWF